MRGEITDWTHDATDLTNYTCLLWIFCPLAISSHPADLFEPLRYTKRHHAMLFRVPSVTQSAVMPCRSVSPPLLPTSCCHVSPPSHVCNDESISCQRSGSLLTPPSPSTIMQFANVPFPVRPTLSSSQVPSRIPGLLMWVSVTRLFFTHGNCAWRLTATLTQQQQY